MPLRQKTTFLNKETADAQREWFVVDVSEKVLGRAATRIAEVLCGKHKPIYTPHVDSGDFVIVLNASKAKLTGQKMQQKMYRHHTGYIGHLRERTAAEMFEKDPEEAVRKAVWGMLPKTRLGRKMLKKLKIYSGSEHSHSAQMPRELAL